MLPKKIYLNYVDENDVDKTWSEEPVSVNSCEMQNREYTDLSQIWHDASEEPEHNRLIVYNFGCLFSMLRLINYDATWDEMVRRLPVNRWAYYDELVPQDSAKDYVK